MSNRCDENKVTLAQLPDPSEPDAVLAFAMSFDGYIEFGSHSAAMAAARERRRESLADLRNELFCSARTSRHMQNDDVFIRYRELLPQFRLLLDEAR